MSIQSKFPGKCKDCKTEFTKNTEIATNDNDNWCKFGKKCPAFYQTTDSVKSEEPATPNSKGTFTKDQLEKIDKNFDVLIELENLAVRKLQGSDDVPPNPAKVGMYMKFLYDSLEKKI